MVEEEIKMAYLHDEMGEQETIFQSPTFSPVHSESESESSVEHTNNNNNNNNNNNRVRKIQKTNDQLQKEIAFLKLKISSIEKQKGSQVMVLDDRPAGITKKYVWDELSKKDNRIEELEK